MKKKVYIISGSIVALLIIAGCVAAYFIQPNSLGDVSGGECIALKDVAQKITKGGAYCFTGSAQGSIHLNTEAKVSLALENVNLDNPSGPAIYVEGNGDVEITLIGENVISATTLETLDGAIFSKADLEFSAEEGASLTITSTDHGIVGKDSIVIKNGSYTISADGKGISANDDLTISAGEIDILRSYEGMEANNISIDGGEIMIVAEDDGLNAVNSDGSNMVGRSGDAKLDINGGTITIDASGDGIDSNGSIEIAGGTIYINGPTTSADSAIDCDGEIAISGGTIIAVGAAGMAQNATSATQPSILINLSNSYQGSLEFGGLKFSPSKTYNSVLISAPSLRLNQTYELTIDGTVVSTVTPSANITNSGNAGMGGFGGGRGFGGGKDFEGGIPFGQGGQRPDERGGQEFDRKTPPANGV